MEATATEELMTADCFAKAYEKGLGQTARLLIRRCGLPQMEAEEYAQAAWVQGWESRAALRSAAALPMWVNTIALNLFRSEQRKAWRREDLSYDPSIKSSPTTGIEAEQALRACSPRDSRLLAGRYMLGYSIAELASREKMGNVALRVRLSRACKQVRQVRAGERKNASNGWPERPVEALNFHLQSVA